MAYTPTEIKGTQVAVREPAFEIVFMAVTPDDVTLNDLNRAMQAFSSLATGIPWADEDDETSDPSAPEKLHLVAVNRGSAVYVMSGPDPTTTRENLLRAGETFDSAIVNEKTAFMLDPAKKLAKLSAKLKGPIIARVPGGGPILATIHPELFERFSNQFVDINKQFVARIERVGGAQRLRCGLRAPHRSRLLICSVRDSNLARLLGNYLYSEVIVSGIATYIKNTSVLFKYQIESVRPMKSGSIVEAFRDIRRAGGYQLDRIANVDKYLGGDEPENVQ